MTNEEKAQLYDGYVHDAGILVRQNSKLKSEHALNMSDDVKKTINDNVKRIEWYQAKITELMG